MVGMVFEAQGVVEPIEQSLGWQFHQFFSPVDRSRVVFYNLAHWGSIKRSANGATGPILRGLSTSPAPQGSWMDSVQATERVESAESIRSAAQPIAWHSAELRGGLCPLMGPARCARTSGSNRRSLRRAAPLGASET